MAKYYLHKQTIAIAIVCLLAVSATAGYVYVKPAPPMAENQIIPEVNSNSQISVGTSTDWKQQFFSISSSTLSLNSNSSSSLESNKPLTLTDTVGRDFFARYIELKQNNLDTNQQLVQGVIDQTIANAQTGATQGKVYTLSDLNLSSDTSSDSIKKYGNLVASVLIKYSPSKSAADVAYSAFNDSNMSELSQIDSIVTSFNTISGLLIKVPVPQPLASNHLDLINQISAMATISQSLRNIEGDPMQSIVALGSYDKTQVNIISYLLNIKTYLVKNNISYGSTEPGLLFATLNSQ